MPSLPSGDKSEEKIRDDKQETEQQENTAGKIESASLEELILYLLKNDIALYTDGNKLKCKGNKKAINDDVVTAMKKYKREIIAWLAEPTITVTSWGRKARIYRWREECSRAGQCQRFINDCELYPLTWLKGWCMERVGAGTKENVTTVRSRSKKSKKKGETN